MTTTYPLTDHFLADVAASEDLVMRARKGDPLALRSLYEQHARYVAGALYRVLGQDADIEDIVQETFVDAMDQLHQLERDGAFRAWLVTIAIRRAQKLLGKRRRRSWILSAASRFFATSSDPKDREPLDDLRDAVAELPEELALPWILARVEEMPLADVAKRCHVSLATAKRRLREASIRMERKVVR